jgi:hypothetical protein
MVVGVLQLFDLTDLAFGHLFFPFFYVISLLLLFYIVATLVHICCSEVFGKGLRRNQILLHLFLVFAIIA